LLILAIAIARLLNMDIAVFDFGAKLSATVLWLIINLKPPMPSLEPKSWNRLAPAKEK
jgi:hypothetical protein